MRHQIGVSTQALGQGIVLPTNPIIEQQMGISKDAGIKQAGLLGAEEEVVILQQSGQGGKGIPCFGEQLVGRDVRRGLEQLVLCRFAQLMGDGEVDDGVGGRAQVERRGCGGEVVGVEVEGVEPCSADCVVQQGRVGFGTQGEEGLVLPGILVCAVLFFEPELQLGRRDGVDGIGC